MDEHENLQLNKSQVKTFSQLLVDLGKLFFTAGVVGFLVPSLGLAVGVGSFSISLLLSILFFFAGIYQLRKTL